ncbi:MAG: hypothetical protein EXR35_08535 [Limnohabitans sp.]|nr:hypothetical protein [Limnohabitans sp.]
MGGYLDVDNTVGYGPEYYFASCNPSQLRVRTHKISVANYAKAQSRLATVQVVSWGEGVLGTLSFELGSPTQDIPAYFLFNVVVSKDSQNGKYSVAPAQ